MHAIMLSTLLLHVSQVQTFSLNFAPAHLGSVLQRPGPYSCTQRALDISGCNRAPCIRQPIRQPIGSLGLRASGDSDGLSRLVDLPGRRYIFVGGKGGVGKTSTRHASPSAHAQTCALK